MPLRLVIENEKQLPDGGPVSFTVSSGGAVEIGRAQYLDWVLPDANKVVSNKHCEIRWRDDGFYLTDTSTNGTYLNGSEDRVHGAAKLKDGDRIAIGHYLVLVSVPDDAAPAPARSAGLPKAVGLDSLWSDAAAAPPISADLLKPRPKSAGNSDFLNRVADLPWNEAPPAPPRLARDRSDEDDWLPRDASRTPEPTPVPAASDAWMAPAEPWAPAETEGGLPDKGRQPANPPRAAAAVREDLPAAAEPRAETPPAPPPPAPEPEPSRPAPDRADRAAARWAEPAAERSAPSAPPRPAESEVMERFARGAGIAPSALAGRDPGDFAEEIGRLVRTIATELKRLLDDRQQAKRTLKVSNHTTIAAFDNNPLKYQPSVEHALALMLGPPSRTYMGAQACIESSLRDVAEHQLLTFSAMQKAVQLLEKELDPSAIEKDVEHDKGLAAIVGFRHSRLWDAYVHRWADRTKYQGDGLTGAFLKDFAKCYDELDQSNS